MSKRSQSAPVPDEQQQQRQLQQQQQRQLQQQSQTSSSLQMPPPSHPYSHSATPPRIVQTHNVPTSITSSIPISATGTVGPVRIKTVSSSLGGGMGTATTVQGRRLQYQLSVPTRLENGAQFIQSSHTPYSSQQSQHHGALGTNGSSNSGLRPVQASIGTGTSTTRSPQQQQLRPAQQNTFDSNRYDGNRASQATNANTNTQTTMATGTTTTGTTNQTGMTDKPKSRKKDKPPRIPPPELIEDNNNKVSYTRGMSLGEY
ncbi:hypothetical protein BCR41DRAFT_194722 [Lobosporangium transversale]|uniref:Uncharacterized protein n=1 Tax=Lobosporangium transversale TaxID=64571 RepID=A0A1Y2G8Y5_9FUNG|nr:hypothetical protein BCR41DRAFT_194722 [Lobosporangium transversale]ORZ04535.1 hypothetical protein BCR41DRAFT_194722 [Lobosporangium transversale]|eukprot:XP_021876581.1 hypothetical protein BCR41DRAFT_194722 [Lobosporangium transversale]